VLQWRGEARGSLGYFSVGQGLGRAAEEGRGRESRPWGGGDTGPRPRVSEGENKSFSFLFSHLLLKPLKKELKNHFEFKNHHSIKHMQQHGCSNMCLNLIVTFNKNSFLTTL